MLASVAPASAQRTGSRIGRDATAKDATTAVRMIAECYYSRSPKHVSQWLDMLPGDEREAKLLQNDADVLSPCLDSDQIVFDGKAVHFTPTVLRLPAGAVMARRLLLKMPHPAAPALDTKPWFTDRLAKLGADVKVNQNALALQDFGHCIALSRWTDSIALIEADDGSPAEQAAVTALLPTLGNCIYQGVTIKVTRRNLREMIGEPVYHLLLQPAVAGGSR